MGMCPRFKLNIYMFITSCKYYHLTKKHSFFHVSHRIIFCCTANGGYSFSALHVFLECGSGYSPVIRSSGGVRLLNLKSKTRNINLRKEARLKMKFLFDV